MTSDANPWLDLTIPASPGSYSSRRVSVKTPHSFFWAKNDRGQCCLIFSCDLEARIKVVEPRLHGIEIEQHINSDTKLNLIIKLVEDPSRDLFRTICNDLILATISISADKSGMVIKAISLRLKRWQELLGRKKSEVLSKPEQIGLFGELYFLKTCFWGRFDLPTAIATWQGPMGAEQDFGWSDFLFEIKTQLSTSDRKVTINSLEQLDDISGKIWLVHQTVAASDTKIGESQSLKELVEATKAHFASDAFASDGLTTILLELGYEDRSEYDELQYSINQRLFFPVKEDFPNLKRSDLPTEIISARYTIDIAALSNRALVEEDFLIEVFENDESRGLS